MPTQSYGVFRRRWDYLPYRRAALIRAVASPSLLTAGYFQTTYFSAGYWADNYWLESLPASSFQAVWAIDSTVVIQPGMQL